MRALGPLQAIYLPGHWILTNLSFTLPHTSQSTPCQHNRSAFYGSPKVQSEKHKPSCHPILNFTFSRHASQKFSGKPDDVKKNDDITTKGNHDNWGRRNLWEVIGKYDMLRVESHVELNEILCQPDNGLVANTGVVLVCFGDFPDRIVHNEDGKKRYEQFLENIRMDGRLSTDGEQTGNGSDQSPFLFLAQFAISAPAHERGKEYDSVLALMNRIRDELINRYNFYCTELSSKLPEKSNSAESQEPLEADELFFFRSLGAFDIALVALPRTPTQLCALIHFAHEARKLLLSDVCDPDPAGVPGHAFALVEDIVAYRTTAEGNDKRSIEHSTDRMKEFANQWKDWGLELQTDVMVDSGHEQHVETKIPRLKRRKNSKKEPRRLSGLHTMRLEYGDVHKFVAEWTPLLSDKTFHVATLIDSTSSLAIRPPFTSKAFDNPPSSIEPAWKLCEENFLPELANITNAIRNWAESLQILQIQQQRELNSLLQTFTNSFSRLDTATALRDLLPFMRQLAACLGREEWPAFWQDPEISRSQIKQDSTKLIAHLGRAFQNRLEPRSQYADPAIYRTLEHGASKIVPAYSTIYWLTSELFADRSQAPAKESAHNCPADHCGVCLAIGSNGTVAFSEIFGDFRTWLLEEHEVSALKHVSFNSTWTTPLILLDASGHQLLQPETHTIHSFHETILFSDWIQFPNQDSLRAQLNIYQLNQIIEIANKQCDKIADDLSKYLANPDSEASRIVKELAAKVAGNKQFTADVSTWTTVKQFFGPLAIASALEQQEGSTTSPPLSKFVDYCHETDPRWAKEDYVQRSLTEWYRTDTITDAARIALDESLNKALSPNARWSPLNDWPPMLSALICHDFIELLTEELLAKGLDVRERVADGIRLRLVYHLIRNDQPTPSYEENFYKPLAHMMAEQLKKTGLPDNLEIDKRANQLKKSFNHQDQLDQIIQQNCRPFFHRASRRLFLTDTENALLNAFANTVTAVLALSAADTVAPATPIPTLAATDDTSLQQSLARIEYIMRLWAKSCKLGGYPLFQRCENQTPNPITR